MVEFSYQAASRNVPVTMKDINNGALDLGMQEAGKLVEKGVKRGKLDASKALGLISRIRPTLANDELKGLKFAIEAVVENQSIKEKVLAELEETFDPNATLTSNTSTISITALGKALKRPEQFCGMHFFNPVHKNASCRSY